MQLSEGKTVLIVDDDRDVLRAFQKRLWSAGLRVLTAASGVHALQLANESQADAVILDVRLPGPLNGFSLAAALRRLPKWRQTPIVFVTGAVEDGMKERCRRAGGNYFISKPFDEDLIVRLLESLFGCDELAEAQIISKSKRRQPVPLPILPSQDPNSTN